MGWLLSIEAEKQKTRSARVRRVLGGLSPLPSERRRDRVMRLRQGLKPRRDAGGDVGFSARPPADKPVITFEDRCKAPLRPSQRGQTFG
jgi:hypothetical protein